MFTLDPLRFTQFENFFIHPEDHHRGVFLQGIGGRVELHARTYSDRAGANRFALMFDGFKWIPTPQDKLRSRLSDLLPSETLRPERIKELRKQLSQYYQHLPLSKRLEQAIATLVNEKKSSLIMLWDEEDQNKWHAGDVDGINIEPMRETVRIIRPVDNINPVPLAGVLQVDGLHIISTHAGHNASERFHSISHFAHRVSRSDSKSGVSGAVGSGTNTAYDLRDAFRKSTIIKVSASGSVKIISRVPPDGSA